MPWNRLSKRSRCSYCREAFRGSPLEIMLAGGRRGKRVWRWWAVYWCRSCVAGLELELDGEVAEQLRDELVDDQEQGAQLACVGQYHRWESSPWNQLESRRVREEELAR